MEMQKTRSKNLSARSKTCKVKIVITKEVIFPVITVSAGNKQLAPLNPRSRPRKYSRR